MVLGKDLCLWRRNARAERLPKKELKLLCLSLPWAIPYNYIFHIVYFWGRTSDFPNLRFYEMSFPMDPSAPPYSHLTFQPLSWFSWGLSALAACPVLCPGCFPPIPAAVWEGLCQSRQSISAQKGSDVPSSEGVASGTAEARGPGCWVLQLSPGVLKRKNVPALGRRTARRCKQAWAGENCQDFKVLEVLQNQNDLTVWLLLNATRRRFLLDFPLPHSFLLSAAETGSLK